MIRVLFFVAVILALGLGFAWLADRPGEMVLTWQGQRLETSLLVGLAALIVFVAALIAALWLLRSVFASPGSMKRYFRNRKRDRGYESLSRGLIAAGAGDAELARRMTRKTRAALSPKDEPLIHVLEAQTYMIEGRHDDARAKFEAMSELPETRALGLRGLYLEARRLGASEAAQQYAEKAVEKAPHLQWAGQAALEYRSREGDWDQALRLLDKQRAARRIAKPEADRKRAVLLTARAMENVESNPKAASADAQEAVRLAPTLVPAAVTAARALYRLNDLRRGSKIVEKAWKSQPHPELADTYVRARSGDSVQDRLKRARRLEAIKPNHVESLRIVAQAALDAHEHQLARQRAEAALRQQPREGLYLLLADIEEADTGDEGRVRHWMNQAVRAPRDPAWTADGYVADQWAPLSPVTGEIDAFVWKAPVEQLNGKAIEGQSSDHAHDAEKAIASLPPVQKPAAGASGEPPAEKQAGEQPATAPAKHTQADAAPKAAPEPQAPGETKADASEPKAEAPKADVAEAAQPERPAVSGQTGSESAAGTETGEAADRAARPRTGWGGRPLQAKRVAEAPKAASDTASESSSTSAPGEKAGEVSDGNVVALQKPRSEKPSGSEGKRTDATGPDPDGGASSTENERERQFMDHRIDDPGVRQTRQESTPQGSRFRLF